MGIVNTLEKVYDHITDNYPQFTYGNCSIQSESIFNNLLTYSGAQKTGIIVGFGGSSVRNTQASEFLGTLVTWVITTNIFVALQGDDSQEAQQILDTYALVDTLVDDFRQNSTLGGEVMDIVFDRIEEPMVYERQSINAYLMLTIYWHVKENF